MTKNRISIIGVGGGGCRLLSLMSSACNDILPLVAVDTDAAGLEMLHNIPVKIDVGGKCTSGFGTGGNVNSGFKCAQENRHILSNLIVDKDVIIIVASLGGGTATGIVPQLVDVARSERVITICFLTIPFDFEGVNKKDKALKAIDEIKRRADMIIVLPNDLLVKGETDGYYNELFDRANDALIKAIICLWKCLSSASYIKLEIPQLLDLAKCSSGICFMSTGEGEEAERAKIALDTAIKSRLTMNGKLLNASPRLLACILGGDDLKLSEIEYISLSLAGLTADITIGTSIDIMFRGRIFLVIFGANEQFIYGKIDDKEKGKDSLKDDMRQGTFQWSSFVYSRYFDEVEPTIIGEENLDIPTFIRRGIKLEK